MLLSTNKKALLLGLAALLLFCRCGEDSIPFGPESRPIPEMFPLAQGAKWEYQYSYTYHYSNDNQIDPVTINEELSGKYSLTVTAQQTYQDSIIYVLSAVTAPEEGSGGTEEWRVRLYSDTLWYELDQQWVYMMPSTFVAGGYVDLRIFLPPIGRRYDLTMGTQYDYEKENVNGHNYMKWFCETSSYLVVADLKGVTGLDLLWCEPYTSTLRKQVWLLSYTPGTP